jgi:hypothetical protein
MNGRWLDITLYLKGAFKPTERPPQPARAPREGGQQRGGGGQGGGGGGGRGTYSRQNRLRLSGLPFEATRDEVAEALTGLGACCAASCWCIRGLCNAEQTHHPPIKKQGWR